EQGRLEEVAEAAAPGVRPPEVAAEETEGKLLEEFVGRVRLAERAEEVAARGPAVALQELLPGGAHRFFRPLVRLAHHRPERGQLAQVATRARCLHAPPSRPQRMAMSAGPGTRGASPLRAPRAPSPIIRFWRDRRTRLPA